MRNSPRSQRGATETLGLVVMAPVMMAAAVVLIWLSRQVDTQAQIHTAAEAAAQAAALQRSPSEADHVARTLALEMLERSDLCAQVQVAVNLGEFGPGGDVSVEISCWVSKAGLQAVSHGGGEARLWARATARLDRFKQIESSQSASRQSASDRAQTVLHSRILELPRGGHRWESSPAWC
jgi:hypothetical protein